MNYREIYKTEYEGWLEKHPERYPLITNIEKEIKGWNKIIYGTAFPDWEDMTIKEKTVHGFSKAIFMTSENLINGRYGFWSNVIENKQVEGIPIPQLKFESFGSPKFQIVSGMIKNCLKSVPSSHSGLKTFELFVDWLLYAWGSSLVKELPVEITDQMNKFWYENFHAELLYIYPSDYFAVVASELYEGKGFNTKAFYPTPPHIVQLMVDIAYIDKPNSEANKYEGVSDPCMGSGIMLLYSSNHSLRLFGCDIDPLMHKLATLNALFYIPWIVANTKETDKLLDDLAIKYGVKKLNEERKGA